jgi:hypothetical protein
MSDSYQSPEFLEKTIQTKDITFTYTVSRISIRCRLVNLTKTAVFDIIFHDQDGECCKSEVMILTPEEYSNWGADDNYIMSLVQEKYGIVFT